MPVVCTRSRGGQERCSVEIATLTPFGSVCGATRRPRCSGVPGPAPRRYLSVPVPAIGPRLRLLGMEEGGGLPERRNAARLSAFQHRLMPASTCAHLVLASSRALASGTFLALPSAPADPLSHNPKCRAGLADFKEQAIAVPSWLAHGRLRSGDRHLAIMPFPTFEPSRRERQDTWRAA